MRAHRQLLAMRSAFALILRRSTNILVQWVRSCAIDCRLGEIAPQIIKAKNDRETSEWSKIGVPRFLIASDSDLESSHDYRGKLSHSRMNSRAGIRYWDERLASSPRSRLSLLARSNARWRQPWTMRGLFAPLACRFSVAVTQRTRRTATRAHDGDKRSNRSGNSILCTLKEKEMTSLLEVLGPCRRVHSEGRLLWLFF